MGPDHATAAGEAEGDPTVLELDRSLEAHTDEAVVGSGRVRRYEGVVQRGDVAFDIDGAGEFGRAGDLPELSSRRGRFRTAAAASS